MIENLRHSGIGPLGDLPWGAHVCLFYENRHDLLEALVPYFSAGAKSNERCFWALGDHLTEGEAKAALSSEIPDLDRRLAEGAVEIVAGRGWYLPNNLFELRRIIRSWHAKLAEALDQGFDGLRVTGDAFWIETSYREGFAEYELELQRSMAGRRMIVLCTYAAGLSRAVDVLDVAHAHQFTLARRHGDWEVLETPDLIRAKQELLTLQGELEDRVRLRTRELAAANAQLHAENHERERAEAALADAQTELARAARLTSLGVLAASIAHEINQPLAAIVTNSEASIRLLAGEPPNVTEARVALGQIAHDARRAADVIQRLRDLVAGTANHAALDVNQAIDEVIALMRSRLQARKVAIRLELDPAAPHVLGDRLQLEQAIINLVVNAAEAMSAMSAQREVTIRSGVRDDGAVVLSVEDNGPGVDAGAMERLFDPFFTTKSGGMGMGLSIARSVAEAHGGSLSVSPGSVCGAVFQIILPDPAAAT